MELRLAEDENKESSTAMSTGGLKLAGGNGENNPSEGSNDDPWDFKKEGKVMESPSISRPIEHDVLTVSSSSPNSSAPTISLYVCLACFAIQIASMIFIASQPAIDLYTNLMKWQLFYGLCELVMIVDVIILNVFDGKKISLILLALFAPNFYPWRRSKHAQKCEGLGVLCTLGSIIAAVALVVCIFSGVKQYGTAIAADDETRKEVAGLMDQVDESGNRYGDMITEDIMINIVEYEQVNGLDAIVIEGSGTITFENDAFINNIGSSVITQLAFVKGDDGTYKIAGVQLGETLLSEYGAKMYWNTIIEK
ncbi:MAG: hypothetical protein IJP29_05035 [Lachnospiraceae bacterium]|nr:hypothetical protein [Lachnospiraceae bacterium]